MIEKKSMGEKCLELNSEHKLANNRRLSGPNRPGMPLSHALINILAIFDVFQ